MYDKQEVLFRHIVCVGALTGMTTPTLSDFCSLIENRQYRAAAEFLLQAKLMTPRERDPAIIAAMLSTCHLPLRQAQVRPKGTIKELVLDRMIALRWIKPVALLDLMAPVRPQSSPTEPVTFFSRLPEQATRTATLRSDSA